MFLLRRYSFTLVLAIAWLIGLSATGLAEETYPRHPDSEKQPGVPEGEVTAYRFTESEIYPGTERDYFVYVPAQYDGSKPAALMVFQDGEKYIKDKGSWRVPIVFDNLIHRGEMPVTIGVFINPGVVTEGDEAQSRFNRSFEYDTVSDRYARFIVQEILPEVAGKHRVTRDPNLCGIAGSSSGAIAAFGVAWHRPDRFRRVFSTVGTFVGLRGGNEYPTLIRKTEPKPLRVFLQDGNNDLDIYGGSWWNANLTMLSALQWAGYEVNHAWGEGGHNGKHGSAIFPDAMRWLWQDFDKPITTSVAEHPELKDRMVAGESWQRVSGGHGAAHHLTRSPSGDVYFADTTRGEIWKVDVASGEAKRFADEFDGISALACDADGNLYCAQSELKRLSRLDAKGSVTEVASGVACHDLVILDHGIYAADTLKGTLWYLPHSPLASELRWQKAGEGPRRPQGLTVTPDKRFLLVSDGAGRYVWSFRIDREGTLQYGQPYGYVHSPQDEIRTGAGGLAMSAEGEPLLATRLGIQIFDQPGRVHVILQPPRRVGRVTSCLIAGEKLYASQGGAVFARPTKMEGVTAWQAASVPPRPRL